jgi:hypothetical protein
MNEEYLWDKSGEPDPEIQKLEDILGTLRYQPTPLELPDVIRRGGSNRNRYISWAAIAAMLLLAILAGVVWLRSQTKGLEAKRLEDRQALVPSPSVPVSSPNPEVIPPNKEQRVENDSPSTQRRKQFVAVHRKPRTVESVPSNEALLAKEQLMSALRLTSEKLNLAQRKTQGPTPTQIRNQHKVG